MTKAPSRRVYSRTCEWSRDETLSTSRFTTAYCREHSLPRLDARTLLIDVVASSGTPRGAGALLVLACYLLVCRSRKYERVATIAVTSQGKSLFTKLGFQVHNFRPGLHSVNFVSAETVTLSNLSKAKILTSKV